MGLDLLPMVIYGAGKVLPKKAWTLRKGRIHIDVGQPISRTELHAMGDYMQQARTVRALYEQRYSTLANEIEKDA